MTTDTTLPDEGVAAAGQDVPVTVGDAPPVEQVQPEPQQSTDPVQQARDRIAKDRTETVRREAGASDQSQPPHGAVGDAAPAAGTTPAPEPEASASPTNGQSQPAEPPRLLKLKVNGVEKELSEAEVIAAAQKQLAGIDALRLAASVRQGGVPQAPTPTPTPGAQPSPPTSAPSSSAAKEPDREKLAAWAEAIAYGDVDKVASALQEFRSATDTPASIPDTDVAAQVDRAIRFARFEDAHRAAETKVASDYPEVKADPVLYDVASKFATFEAGKALVALNVGITPETLASAPPAMWWQRLTEAHMLGYPVDLEAIYREGARQAAEKYGRPAAPQTPAPSELDARRAAKGAAIQPPRAASAIAMPPPPNNTTIRDKVAEMKKARGQ